MFPGARGPLRPLTRPGSFNRPLSGCPLTEVVTVFAFYRLTAVVDDVVVLCETGFITDSESFSWCLPMRGGFEALKEEMERTLEIAQ